jgi:hypothetical protein
MLTSLVMNLLLVTFVVALILKLMGKIAWRWTTVLLPAWILLAIFTLALRGKL